MITSEIIHRGGSQFEATSRGHWIMCDQPFEYGGTDEGMNPPELLLAALGTCAGYYAADYLKARGLPTAGLRVRVRAEKLLHPPRLEDFTIEVVIPALEERYREGLHRAVEACLIHRTLLAGSPVRIFLASDRGALAPA